MLLLLAKLLLMAAFSNQVQDDSWTKIQPPAPRPVKCAKVKGAICIAK